MRRLDLTFTALLLPLDFLAFFAAGITAYSLRTSRFFIEIRPILQEIPLVPYLAAIAAFSIIWMVLFMIAGLYSTRLRRAWNELGRVALACTAGVAIVIVTIFFRREWTASRFIVFALWPLTILYLSAGRLILRAIRKRLLAAGYGHQRIVIIGQNKVAEDIATLYRANPTLGYSVVRTFRSWSDTTEQEMQKLIKKSAVDSILLADPALPREKALNVIAFSEEQHLQFHYLADLFAARFTRIEMSTAGGIPVIEVKRTPLDGWGRIAKRVFDLVASILFLVVLSPIMLVTAIAIVLETKGGVFFSYLPNKKPVQRVGEGGRLFHYFKFRSMEKDRHFERYNELASQNVRSGPLVKTQNDPRITKVGAFIRKWSIDELPELILVFLGRMSLVGPRPHYPEEVEKYEPGQRRVLTIKPGITGMAQISGRSDLDFADEVRLDTWYIENWSIWLDLYILLKTPLAVIGHRKVE